MSVQASGAGFPSVAPEGTLLGYSDNAAMIQALTAAPVDIPLLTKTVVTNGRPVGIIAHLPTNIVGGAVAGNFQYTILEDGVLKSGADSPVVAVTLNAGTVDVLAEIPSLAGSHTYKVQGAMVTATDGTAVAIGLPAFLEIVQP